MTTEEICFESLKKNAQLQIELANLKVAHEALVKACVDAPGGYPFGTRRCKICDEFWDMSYPPKHSVTCQLSDWGRRK